MPTLSRSSRTTADPTACSMRRTCRFLPSRIVSSSRVLPLPCPSSDTSAGPLWPSPPPSSTPLRSCSSTASPSTLDASTRYVFGRRVVPLVGSVTWRSSQPSLVRRSKPDVLRSKRPTASHRPSGKPGCSARCSYTVGRLSSSLCVTMSPAGLWYAMTCVRVPNGAAGRGPRAGRPARQPAGTAGLWRGCGSRGTLKARARCARSAMCAQPSSQLRHWRQTLFAPSWQQWIAC